MEDIRTMPPAYWAGRFFTGLTRYLRAAKASLIKLRAHLAQPDSLGIALLAAASSQLLCVQLELDGRGSLEVFPDAAVITVFEYKSSLSGTGVSSSSRECSPVTFLEVLIRFMYSCSGVLHACRSRRLGMNSDRHHTPESTRDACSRYTSSELVPVLGQVLARRGTVDVLRACAGCAKGKRQLAARLAMLVWAARESSAVPAGTPLKGRGHLYLPGYARVGPHDVCLEGGSMTISIASI